MELRRYEAGKRAGTEAASLGAPAIDVQSHSDCGSDAGGQHDRVDIGPLPAGLFVGREPQLVQLRAAVAEAAKGVTKVILIAGEPGIGKTRLAEHAGSYAQQHGLRVCWGRCWEGDGAAAFWPWVQILRGLIQGCEVELLRSCITHAPDIAQLVPELREHLSIPPAAELSDSWNARFRLFSSISSFLRNIGEVRPLVMVLDDLHCADRVSLLLLEFLARELRSAKVLVIGSYRDSEFASNPAFLGSLAQLARESCCERIDLRGFAREDVAVFIGHVASRRVPDAMVTAVYQRTEGNPFFLTELVRLLAVDGGFAQSDAILHCASIPPTVRDAIQYRLRRLTDKANEMLEIAAVIGREFDVSVLRHATELPLDRLVDTLDEVVAAGVTSEITHRVGAFRFVHVLIRDVLYEGLTVARRTTLHRKVGEVLEKQCGKAPDPSALAYHFFRSLPQGNAPQAVAYAVRAGMAAMQSLAYEEAAEQYARALQALEFDEPDDTRRCELLLVLGEAQDRAGHTSNACATFQTASALARTLGQLEMFARAALGFGSEIRSGYVDGNLVSLLEEALCLLGDADSALRSLVLSRLARAIFWSPLRLRGDALTREAIRIAQRMNDVAAQTAALTSRYMILSGPDYFADRTEIGEELAQLAERESSAETLILATRFRVIALLEAGDRPAADSQIAKHRHSAYELRAPLFLYEAGHLYATQLLLQGNLSEADAVIQLLRSKAERFQTSTALPWFWAPLFLLRRDQGRLSEVVSDVEHLLERYPWLPLFALRLKNVFDRARCSRAYVWRPRTRLGCTARSLFYGQEMERIAA